MKWLIRNTWTGSTIMRKNFYIALLCWMVGSCNFNQKKEAASGSEANANQVQDEQGSEKKVDIIAGNETLAPDEVVVKASQVVRFSVMNKSNQELGFRVNVSDTSAKLEQPVKPGKIACFSFQAPDHFGVYSFYALAGAQPVPAMKGRLVVKE